MTIFQEGRNPCSTYACRGNSPDERERTIREERSTANQRREARGYPVMPVFSPFEFADHLKPVVLLAMNTGLRRGELFSVTWADVDLVQGNLTVRGDVAKSAQTAM